ncbi:multiple sugar transport system substrate-binding protein [Mycetocola sp. BIGb0189]|uniref:sugar ABC transporter substrate-binding protein n=1 Tax=Mycetocola sp. BIGb0189 TaxID=2940604 RepID=UPI002167D9CA|nr:extracellular solute-binding protein [Mycetocola sp. BIGb0189]MCS4276595.1 multiple sugar transport system substrate-binding protein [Mycetocola sp. BIGb0189]
MEKKHRLTVLASLALVPLALSGCSAGGSGGGASSDADTLSVVDYYVNDPDQGLVVAALDKCAAELKVKLNRTGVPGKDLIQKVLQMSSSKTLPDVLMLDNPDLQEIASSGGLTPLSQFNVDTSGFAQGILDAATYQGEVYGLAPTVNTLGLFVNKAMLDEAGLAIPTTWDELKTTAQALSSGDRYGLAFSSIATYEGSWQFLPFLWTNGGSEDKLDSPEAAEALQLQVDLVNSGAASKSVINWSQADVKDQFMAGKAAMMINGPWQIPALNADPSLTWTSVQVPINKAGQTPTAPLGGEVWTVPQTGNKEKQAKAAKFVECITSDDNQLSLAESRFTVPTKTALAAEYVQKVPDMAAFTEQVANARSRTGILGEDWPKAATVMYTGIQLALTGKESASDAFSKAKAG